MIWRQLRTSILFAAAGGAALCQTLVVPNSQATTPGNAPINLGGKAKRIQEVLGSGQFTGPVTITALRLRAAPGAGPAKSTSDSFQVTLSTTQAYPNTTNGHTLPSLTYANNTGPDATVVYKGAGALSSPGCAAPGPCPFDIVIPSAPFTYDPNQGRLLIDIVASAPTANQGSLDGVAYSDPSGSVVTVSGDPTQPAGTLTLAGFVFGIDTGAPGTALNVTEIVDAGGYTETIAPGSLFVVKGTNLCNSTAQATVPYQTTALGGVTIQFTPVAGGASVPAYMESTYCANGVTQVAGILPSSVAPGNYNATVTSSGSTSAPFQTTVAATKFGIMTLPGSGSGRALVQNVVSGTQYDLNGFTTGPVSGASYQRSPATPGEYLIIWGMGLGAAAGYDASAPSAGLDFLPQGLIVQVIVGGMRITPSYAGRSNLYPGLDNVVFQLPSNVQTGCDVPLQVRAGGGGSGGGGGAGHLSNVTTISIAPAGAAACSSPMLSTSALSKLDQGQPVTMGMFLFVAPPGGNRPFIDGQFAKFGGDQISQASLFFTAPGTCRVTASNTATGLPSGLGAVDAGAVSLNGPSIANQAIPQGADKTYSFTFSSNPVTSGGTYTLSGAGGKDIGPFSATGVIEPVITVTSALPSTIPRSQDLTITWTGGTGTDFVTLFGAASAPIDANTPNTEVFACTTTVDKGTITVPSTILSQLPATPANPNAANLLLGFWFRAPSSASGLFTAPLTGGGSTDAGIFIAALGGGAVPAFYQ